jgi:P27 family predicted phage terminase small subunit
MIGRKPKSTRLKLIAGTARKHRLHPEPTAPEDRPEPPADLDHDERKQFLKMRRRVEDLRIATSADTEALAVLACRLAEVVRLSELIRKLGSIYVQERKEGAEGSVRVLKANPAVAQRSEAWRHIQSLVAEFGLTPASRSKVTVPEKQPEASPWAAIVKR